VKSYSILNFLYNEENIVEKDEQKGNEDNTFKDLVWSFEMYHFYMRKTLISFREYNDQLIKLRKSIAKIQPLAENLKKSVSAFKID